MSDFFGGFGDVTKGIGNLIGAAGDVYGLTQSGESSFNKAKNPFRSPFVTPAYTFGGGLLARNNNDVQQGLQQQRNLIGDLQTQVSPGYGKLTEQGVAAIRQAGAQASGNLRAQLAARGLSGASFAQDQLASVGNEFAQQEAQFRTQAFTAEMEAANKLIDSYHSNIAQQAAQELGELGVAANFLSQVPQVALTSKAIDQLRAQLALLDKFQNPPPANSNTPAATPATITPARPRYRTVVGGH